MADLNEFILEIRYKPSSKIIDHRGIWAEKISEYMNLPEWRITDNRIDVFDKESENRTFLSYKNIGCISNNIPTENYFSDKAIKYIKYLFDLEEFPKNLHIERIGLRGKYCKEYNGNFEELLGKYTTNFLSLTETARKIMSSKLIDIGGPLYFADQVGNFNTNSGPMRDIQIANFFNKNIKDVPLIGLYIDIDYWIKPQKHLGGREVSNYISNFTNSTWDKIKIISDIVLGKNK